MKRSSMRAPFLEKISRRFLSKKRFYFWKLLLYIENARIGRNIYVRYLSYVIQNMIIKSVKYTRKASKLSHSLSSFFIEENVKSFSVPYMLILPLFAFPCTMSELAI